MRRSTRCTHIFFTGFLSLAFYFPLFRPHPTTLRVISFQGCAFCGRLCVWLAYLKLETPTIVFDVTFLNRRLTYDPEWFECGGSETAFGWEQNTRSEIRRRYRWVGRIKLKTVGALSADTLANRFRLNVFRQPVTRPNR